MRQFNYRVVRLKHSFKRKKHHLTNCHEKERFFFLFAFLQLHKNDTKMFALYTGQGQQDFRSLLQPFENPGVTLYDGMREQRFRVFSCCKMPDLGNFFAHRKA